MNTSLVKSRRANKSALLLYLLFGIGIGLAAGYIAFSGGGVPPQSSGTTQAPAPSPSISDVRNVALNRDTAPLPPEPDELPPYALLPEEVELTAEQVDQANIKPGNFLFIGIPGQSLDDLTRAFIKEAQPGGIVLTGSNIRSRAQTIELISAIKEAAGNGMGIADLPLIAVDQEGGPVNRLRLQDAPSARELGQFKDPARAREVAAAYGVACTARGIGVVFAPVMDVFVEGANPGFRERTFSDDPGEVTALGLAFADGLMKAGVLPVVKHYPGHGAVMEDSHEKLAHITKDAREVAHIMFPFHEAANFDVPGIMIGHIAVPVLDKENPDRPASLSPVLIQDYLRRRWNYSGVVISDDLNMGAITRDYTRAGAVVASLKAGCNAVIFLETDRGVLQEVLTAIEDAMASEELPKRRLVVSKRRLEAWQDFLRQPQRLKGSLPTIESLKIASADRLPPELLARLQEANSALEETPQPAADDIDEAAHEDAEEQAPAAAAKTSDAPADESADAAPVEANEPAVAEPAAPDVAVNAEEPEAPETGTPPEEPPVTETAKPGDEPVELAKVDTETVPEPALPEPVQEETPGIEEAAAPEVEGEPAAEPEEAPAAESSEETAAAEEPAPVLAAYTVQSGDSLSRIASRFDTTVKAIKELNGLKSDNIGIGQELKLTSPPALAALEPEPASIPAADTAQDTEETPDDTPLEVAVDETPRWQRVPAARIFDIVEDEPPIQTDDAETLEVAKLDDREAVDIMDPVDEVDTENADAEETAADSGADDSESETKSPDAEETATDSGADDSKSEAESADAEETAADSVAEELETASENAPEQEPLIEESAAAEEEEPAEEVTAPAELELASSEEEPPAIDEETVIEETEDVDAEMAAARIEEDAVEDVEVARADEPAPKPADLAPVIEATAAVEPAEEPRAAPNGEGPRAISAEAVDTAPPASPVPVAEPLPEPETPSAEELNLAESARTIPAPVEVEAILGPNASNVRPRTDVAATFEPVPPVNLELLPTNDEPETAGEVGPLTSDEMFSSESEPSSSANAADPTGEQTVQVAESRRIEHVFRRGDALIRLARDYNVTVDEIMKWNRLRDQNIRVGTKLVIFVPKPE